MTDRNSFIIHTCKHVFVFPLPRWGFRACLTQDRLISAVCTAENLQPCLTFVAFCPQSSPDAAQLQCSCFQPRSFTKGGSPAVAVRISYRLPRFDACGLPQLACCRQRTGKENQRLKTRRVMYSSVGGGSAGIWISVPLHLRQQKPGDKSYGNFPSSWCCFCTAFRYDPHSSGTSSDGDHPPAPLSPILWMKRKKKVLFLKVTVAYVARLFWELLAWSMLHMAESVGRKYRTVLIIHYTGKGKQ